MLSSRCEHFPHLSRGPKNVGNTLRLEAMSRNPCDITVPEIYSVNVDSLGIGCSLELVGVVATSAVVCLELTHSAASWTSSWCRDTGWTLMAVGHRRLGKLDLT